MLEKASDFAVWIKVYKKSERYLSIFFIWIFLLLLARSKRKTYEKKKVVYSCYFE